MAQVPSYLTLTENVEPSIQRTLLNTVEITNKTGAKQEYKE